MGGITITTQPHHAINQGDKVRITTKAPWWKFWARNQSKYYRVTSVDSATTMTTRRWKWYDTLSTWYWRIKRRFNA